MEKLTFDFSGIEGLVERHQGDINDTSASPHLRYLGSAGQFASGYFNPLKKYGYMAPANNSFTSLTGSVAAGVNSIVYDAPGDIVYMSEAGENILKLDGMDDTSLANVLSITSGHDIKDMLVYEINGKRSLAYVIETNEEPVASNGTFESLGMYVGFYSVDQTDGATMLQKNVQTSLSGGAIQERERNIVDAGSENFNAQKFRKLAFEFDADDVNPVSLSSRARSISGVELKLRRSGGTGSGITMKVSLQGDATASAAPYTDRGGWVTATAYAINDTVTSVGQTYQCYSAHTSGASTQPGVGGSWETVWSVFGAPNGTELASGTFALSSVDDYSELGNMPYRVQFSSSYELSIGTQYWIVIEESGSNMTATDSMSVLGTHASTGIYAGNDVKGWFDEATDYWRSVNQNNTGYGADTIDFRLILNRDDDWTLNSISGRFAERTGQRTFLYRADNGLLYWVVGNSMHAIDGSITGGGSGTISEDVLVFPSYINLIDITETRSRMYLGIQSSSVYSVTSPIFFGADVCGVYVWDRRSQVSGSSDFYPCPGAKELKSVFKSSDGSVKVITVGNSGFTEIRAISGNQYAVIHTLERDGYPSSRHGISQIDGLSVWLGANGVFYGFGSVAPGSPEALYKLGTMAGQAAVGSSLVPGPILVGNEHASSIQQAIIFGWTDADPSYNVQKWYPNGVGTMDSVSQVAHVGDIYSIVRYLPELSIARSLTIYCAPTADSSSSVIATIKIYFNQSSTASITKSITQTQAQKGYVHFELNKPNVNSVQVEIEHTVAQTISATNSFYPSVGILEYDMTRTHTPDAG